MIGLIYNDFDIDYYRQSLSICLSLIDDVNDSLAFKANPFNDPIDKEFARTIVKDEVLRKKVNDFLKKFDIHSSHSMLMNEVTPEELAKARAFLKVIKVECEKRTIGKAYTDIIWFKK